MSARDEFQVNALRDVEFSECVCNDCGNKFKGLPVKNIECPACRSLNITKN
jgi:predicted Zn-ribbon and HTH transcriptional regulator